MHFDSLMSVDSLRTLARREFRRLLEVTLGRLEMGF